MTRRPATAAAAGARTAASTPTAGGHDVLPVLLRHVHKAGRDAREALDGAAPAAPPGGPVPSPRAVQPEVRHAAAASVSGGDGIADKAAPSHDDAQLFSWVDLEKARRAGFSDQNTLRCTKQVCTKKYLQQS